MSSTIVVGLDCPHCQHHFLEAASLVRPQAEAYCPSCARTFRLDPEIEAMSRLLHQAKAARRERKRRRQEIIELFGPVRPHPLPASARPEAELGSMLSRLDILLERLRDGYADDEAEERRSA